MDYYDIVRVLPRPTDAQRDAFALGMAQRHSWYKHLSVRPLVPFRFMIAPRAPLTSEPGSRLLDKRYAVVWTAEAHKRLYGYWMCTAPYAGGGGLAPSLREEVARAEGWTVYGPADEKVLVPREILDAGVAWVNAFVDPRASRCQAFWPRHEQYGLRAYFAEIGYGDVPLQEEVAMTERVLTAEHVTAERERMLAEMRAAMDRVRALIWPA